ncbi:MAG: hypothetical protein AAF202_07670, partial [Pseudomonadota bacterium]
MLKLVTLALLLGPHLSQARDTVLCSALLNQVGVQEDVLEAYDEGGQQQPLSPSAIREFANR